MKTHTGLWDALFGEKVTLEVPSDNGDSTKVVVTTKWIDKMEREGRIKKVESSEQTSDTDPLEEKAKMIVSGARLASIGVSTPLITRMSESIPDLRKVDLGDWDFFLTVATVFMATIRLGSMGFSEDRIDRLMAIVSRELDESVPNGIRGYEDCRMHFEEEAHRLAEAGHEPAYLVQDAVGIWIAGNLLGRRPQTDVECGLVRVTGELVLHLSGGCWE